MNRHSTISQSSAFQTLWSPELGKPSQVSVGQQERKEGRGLSVGPGSAAATLQSWGNAAVQSGEVLLRSTQLPPAGSGSIPTFPPAWNIPQCQLFCEEDRHCQNFSAALGCIWVTGKLPPNSEGQRLTSPKCLRFKLSWISLHSHPYEQLWMNCPGTIWSHWDRAAQPKPLRVSGRHFHFLQKILDQTSSKSCWFFKAQKQIISPVPSVWEKLCRQNSRGSILTQNNLSWGGRVVLEESSTPQLIPHCVSPTWGALPGGYGTNFWERTLSQPLSCRLPWHRQGQAPSVLLGCSVIRAWLLAPPGSKGILFLTGAALDLPPNPRQWHTTPEDVTGSSSPVTGPSSPVTGPSSPSLQTEHPRAFPTPLTPAGHSQSHTGEHLPLLELRGDLPSSDLNSSCFPQFLLFQNVVQSYVNLMSKINSPTFPEAPRWERGFGGSCPFLVGFVVEMWSSCTRSPNATWPEIIPNLHFHCWLSQQAPQTEP